MLGQSLINKGLTNIRMLKERERREGVMRGLTKAHENTTLKHLTKNPDLYRMDVSVKKVRGTVAEFLAKEINTEEDIKNIKNIKVQNNDILEVYLKEPGPRGRSVKIGHMAIHEAKGQDRLNVRLVSPCEVVGTLESGGETEKMVYMVSVDYE